MKRSRTVYGGLDSLDGLGEHSRKELTQSSDDACVPMGSSWLTCDMLDKRNRFYRKSQRVVEDSTGSEGRLDGTDTESDVSSHSCGEDVVEVNDTSSMNRVDRLLEIEINSVKTAEESDDNDSFDGFDYSALFECSKVFSNPSRNDTQLVNDFNLLEVSAQDVYSPHGTTILV